MNTERNDVKVTPGAVVDVVTPRGLSSAIVQNVRDNEGECSGFLVRNADHQEILHEHTWLTDEIVYVHEDERSAIWSNEDGEGVVFFKEGDTLTVGVIGAHRHGRRVGNLREGLKVATTYLHQNGLADLAATVERAPDIMTSVLSDILEV